MSAYVKTIVKKARAGSYKLASLSSARKNKALRAMAKALLRRQDYILGANKKDVAAARENGYSGSLIDRLALDKKRIVQMARSLREVAALADPVGEVLSKTRRPNGIHLEKVRVPIGVVLIVYEARPNVTSDCVGLLFKTSNVGILRGGSSAIHSNSAIGTVLKTSLSASGIRFPAFFVVSSPQRSVVDELLKQDSSIDLVIPRGGESLIRKVVETSRIPVIKHYKGVCHLYIDRTVDMAEAVHICVNAKVQRPSVCNAVETILIHKSAAGRFLPLLKRALDIYGVVIRGDALSRKVIGGIQSASERDWNTEYLDLTVAVKVVADIDAAIRHINRYGSHHTDSILTKSRKNAEKFLKEVDSACCFSNISTRFSDGFEFGLGAEIGISTDKLHARGPMGLDELTTYKWIARGNGQIRT